MKRRVIELSKGSFISYKERCENFCNSNYLLIKNCNYKCSGCDINNTLLKFDVNEILSKNMLIKKAILKLPIEMYIKCNGNKFDTLDICVNQQNFNECSVNWMNRPRLKVYKSIDIYEEELESEAIFIDITGLIINWFQDNIPNNGITLRFRSNNILLSILNCSKEHSPSITLHYIEKPDRNKTPFIQLQSTNLMGEVIGGKEVIKFNKLMASDIDYDENLGELTINKYGVYMAQWWVSIEGSENISEISIGLENMGNNNIVCGNAPVNLSSQITGNALVSVNEGEKLRLINMSTNGIQIDNVSVQASLMIARI